MKDKGTISLMQESHPNYYLDLDAPSFDLISPPTLAGSVCSFALKAVDLSKYSSNDVKTITLQIQFIDEHICNIQADGIDFSLTSYGANDWARFFDSYFNQFVNLLIAKLLFKDEKEDILWIEQNIAGKVWVLCLLEKECNRWQGQLVERNRPEYIDMDYALMNTCEQKHYINDIFEKFKAWLPEDFLLIFNHSCGRQKILTIKVHPDELWFLRFPLSIFNQLQYAPFTAYSEVEWIVTDKGFTQNTYERARMRAELSDFQGLFEHSVVIVNTYKEHESKKLYREGTELVIEILQCLQDVNFNTGKSGFRWYVNPSSEKVKQLLLDAQTFYFFADFEASNGQWQMGEGQQRSWNDDLSSSMPETNETSVRQYFSLEDEDLNLSHIRLMRVFHCNSIFDPYEADKREPADNHSIVRHLLNAGAQRVEGGMTEESYFDYLCSLIALFCESKHCGFILKFKCLELAIEFNSLIERVNKFLEACGRDPIPV